jgi:hypothetical protein
VFKKRQLNVTREKAMLFLQKHLSGHREKFDIFETALSITVTLFQAMKPTASDVQN